MSVENSLSSYTIRAHENDTRCTRSQTALLAGNHLSRTDNRMAIRSGFATSVASATPQLYPLPPPCSARQVSTTSYRLALPRLTPTPSEFKSGSLPHAPPLHPAAHGVDVEAVASHLSIILVSYTHRDWEQLQRGTPGPSYRPGDTTATTGERNFDSIRSHGSCGPRYSVAFGSVRPHGPCGPRCLSEFGLHDSSCLAAFSIGRPHDPCGPAARQLTAHTALESR